MNKKYKESELTEQLDNAFDICFVEQYQQIFLICVVILLHTSMLPDDIEWDVMAEREKYESADTN